MKPLTEIAWNSNWTSSDTRPSLISLVNCSNIQNIDLKEPIDETLANQLNTQYYTANVHRAAFALPAFVLKVDEF